MSALNNSNVWSSKSGIHKVWSAIPTGGLQDNTYISTFNKAIIWKSELGMAVVPPKTLVHF